LKLTRLLPGTQHYSVFAPGPVEVDARLTDRSQDDLIASFRSVKVGNNELPLRPDFGTAGKVVKLRTNYFPIKLSNNPLYEYNVSISPVSGTAGLRVKRRIFQLAENAPEWNQAGLRGTTAHDHASKLIAAKKIPQPLTITVPYYDEDQDGPTPGGKEFTLTFQFVQELETQSLIKYGSANFTRTKLISI
jgi:eukaryotic translation initiation factor 2C